jgi:hypothetical protein
MNRFSVPRRRHCDWIRNMFFVIIILEFVIIDWPWILLLLFFLEPAKTKEENTWSRSVVHPDNVGLENKKSSQISGSQQNCRKRT